MRFWLWEFAVGLPRVYRIGIGVGLCLVGWGSTSWLSILTWITGLGFLTAALVSD